VDGDNILNVSDLVKRFGGNRAVDGATFDVRRGSITGLIGPNGAGKTTSFSCIAGALRPDGGHVIFDGEDITGWRAHRVFRRGLVRTFQIPQELHAMSVIENLMLVPSGQVGEQPWFDVVMPWRVRQQEELHAEQALRVLDAVDLAPLAHAPAGSLSGGQRKLLELARALMADPKLILLDEPSAGVNPTLARRLVDDIREIQATRGVTLLVIGHDMDVVGRLCDTLIVMTGGRVMLEGDPETVFADADVQEAYLGSQYR
jgi:branched-chain amino acid transport system ATP-binding protein